MSERKYTLPGMPDWVLQIDKWQNTTLLNKANVGFYINADMTAEAITERIENIVRNRLGVSDEAAIDAVVQAARNIDWQKTIAKPLPELVAVLVNEPQASSAQTGLSAELIDELCAHLSAVYIPLQKLKRVE